METNKLKAGAMDQAGELQHEERRGEERRATGDTSPALRALSDLLDRYQSDGPFPTFAELRALCVAAPVAAVVAEPSAAIWTAITRLERQDSTFTERMAAADDLRALATPPIPVPAGPYFEEQPDGMITPVDPADYEPKGLVLPPVAAPVSQHHACRTCGVELGGMHAPDCVYIGMVLQGFPGKGGAGERKIIGYGDCKCILSRYCDGTCNPLWADEATAAPVPRMGGNTNPSPLPASPESAPTEPVSRSVAAQGMSPWESMCRKAVAILNTHIVPDGISDHEALNELYGIFDSDEYRSTGAIEQDRCDQRQAEEAMIDKTIGMLTASPKCAAPTEPVGSVGDDDEFRELASRLAWTITFNEKYSAAFRAMAAYIDTLISAARAAPAKVDSTQQFWLENRAQIISAIQREGFTLMSNQHGFFLMKLGKAEAQLTSPVSGHAAADSDGGVA